MSLKVIRKKGSKPIRSIAGGPERVKVGFPAGKADSDVVSRALWQEFGTKGGASGGGWGGPIPERPFMRNAMRDGKGKIVDILTAGARAIVRAAARGQDPFLTKRTWLAKTGVEAQGMIQDEITSLSSPPNSPVTIALKGSSNPLIDSGEMRQAVTFQIEE